MTECTVHALCRPVKLLTPTTWCMSLAARGCWCEAWGRTTWTRMTRTANPQPVCWACPSWTAALPTDPSLPRTPGRVHPGNTLMWLSSGKLYSTDDCALSHGKLMFVWVWWHTVPVKSLDWIGWENGDKPLTSTLQMLKLLFVTFLSLFALLFLFILNM